MSTLPARSLEYRLLPGKPPFGFSQPELHDKVFLFWKRFWNQVLERNGSAHKPNPDDFFRQDYIGVLLSEGKIVALHAHSFFDLSLQVTRHHSYFTRYFTPKALSGPARPGQKTDPLTAWNSFRWTRIGDFPA